MKVLARKLATKSSLSSGLGGCEGCDGVWPTKTNWSNEQSNEEHSTSTRQMHPACTAVGLELEDSATLWSVLTKVGIHFSRNEPPGSLAHRLQPLLMAMGIWELRCWCTWYWASGMWLIWLVSSRLVASPTAETSRKTHRAQHCVVSIVNPLQLILNHWPCSR